METNIHQGNFLSVLLAKQGKLLTNCELIKSYLISPAKEMHPRARLRLLYLA
jgi:hypothetical protein